MTAGVDFMPGETAAELTGLSIAEIDAAAATGAIPAHYTGWLLLVDPSSLMPPEDEDEVSTALETSPPESEPAEEVETYDELTVAQLKDELDERRIEYPSGARKAELVALLDADDEA